LLQRDSFWRLPDWRWQRAKLLAQHRVLASPTDDKGTLRAARFLVARQSCGNDKERDQVAQAHRDVYAAWKFAENSEWKRLETQARLLAKEPSAAIAGRIGLEVEVIERFEELFFNIKDRLRAKDWIVERVIGKSLLTGFTPHDIGEIWMTFGYFGGPLALDMIIAACRHYGLAPAVEANAIVVPKLTDCQLRSVQRAIWAMLVPPTASLRQLQEAMVQIRQRKARLAS
jgi:hypothetical protein